MRSRLLTLTLWVLSAGALANPADDAVVAYVDCLESSYAVAKDLGQATVDVEQSTFDQCASARDRISTTLAPDDAKRIIAQIDDAAKAGMARMR